MKWGRMWLLFLLLFIATGVHAQQPVQSLGSGTQNTSDAAWTSATGSNTAVTLISNTATYNAILVTLVQGTTITGGVVTFEQSIDNSTWTTVQGITLGTTAIMGPTYTLVASTNISFLFPVNAPYFRIRLSTVITGSGTVTIQHASQSLPGASITAGYSNMLGSGALNTADAAWTSATGSNTAVTMVSNTQNYNGIMVTLVQGTTITGGVVTFEQSIDNSTWTTVQGVTLGTTAIMGPTYTLVASTNISFLFPVNAPYFRIRLSSVIIGSGTVTVQHASQSLPTVGLVAGTETLAAGTAQLGSVTPSDGTTNIGTLSNFGTTPGAVKALPVNVSIFCGTAVCSATNGLVIVPADGTANMGTMANFGTSPTAVKALNTNASLFIGTTIVSSSNPFPISATGAANSKTNPIFSATSDGTNQITAAISALGTAPTGTFVETVNEVDLPTTAAGGAVSTTSLSTSTTTTGTNIKASAGNLYGIFAINGVASVCWLQFMNSATGGTLGTAPIVSIPLPAVTTQPVWIQFRFPINFTTGIAVGTSTTNNGAVACGTATATVVQFK